MPGQAWDSQPSVFLPYLGLPKGLTPLAGHGQLSPQTSPQGKEGSGARGVATRALLRWQGSLSSRGRASLNQGVAPVHHYEGRFPSEAGAERAGLDSRCWLHGLGGSCWHLVACLIGGTAVALSPCRCSETGAQSLQIWSRLCKTMCVSSCGTGRHSGRGI